MSWFWRKQPAAAAAAPARTISPFREYKTNVWYVHKPTNGYPYFYRLGESDLSNVFVTGGTIKKLPTGKSGLYKFIPQLLTSVLKNRRSVIILHEDDSKVSDIEAAAIAINIGLPESEVLEDPGLKLALQAARRGRGINTEEGLSRKLSKSDFEEVKKQIQSNLQGITVDKAPPVAAAPIVVSSKGGPLPPIPQEKSLQLSPKNKNELDKANQQAPKKDARNALNRIGKKNPLKFWQWNMFKTDRRNTPLRRELNIIGKPPEPVRNIPEFLATNTNNNITRKIQNIRSNVKQQNFIMRIRTMLKSSSKGINGAIDFDRYRAILNATSVKELVDSNQIDFVGKIKREGMQALNDYKILALNELVTLILVMLSDMVNIATFGDSSDWQLKDYSKNDIKMAKQAAQRIVDRDSSADWSMFSGLGGLLVWGGGGTKKRHTIKQHGGMPAEIVAAILAMAIFVGIAASFAFGGYWCYTKYKNSVKRVNYKVVMQQLHQTLFSNKTSESAVNAFKDRINFYGLEPEQIKLLYTTGNSGAFDTMDTRNFMIYISNFVNIKLKAIQIRNSALWDEVEKELATDGVDIKNISPDINIKPDVGLGESMISKSVAPPPAAAQTSTFNKRSANPQRRVTFKNRDKLPDLSTIEALNAYIDSDNDFWKEENNDDEDLQESSNLQLNSEPLDDVTLQPMLTSGNNLDCLIHSFLMSTCEAFRKRIRQGDDGRVTPESRANEFASLFRKRVCPQIVESTFDEVQGQIVESGHNPRDMKAAMISDLTKTGDGNPMLLSELLIILAAYYHINILLFGTDERARGKGVIIPRLYEYNHDDDAPTYIISNQSGGHYEYVRAIRDEASITISLKDAKAIKDTYEENNKADLSLRQYKDGQQIPKKVIREIPAKYNLNKNGAYFVYDVNMDAENPPGPYRPFKVEGKSYLPVPIPKSYCITEDEDTLYKYLEHEAARVKSPEDSKRFSSKILESGKRALDITLHGTCISAEDLHTEEHRRKIIGALTAFKKEEEKLEEGRVVERENKLKKSGHTALSADEADKQIARLLAQTAPGADEEEDEEEAEEEDEEEEDEEELDAQIAVIEARIAKIAELLKKRGRKGGSMTRRGRKTPHKQTKRRRRA